MGSRDGRVGVLLVILMATISWFRESREEDPAESWFSKFSSDREHIPRSFGTKHEASFWNLGSSEHFSIPVPVKFPSDLEGFIPLSWEAVR